MKDFANSFKAVQVINAQTVTTSDVVGADVDRTGFDSLTYLISVGAEGDTPSGSIKLDFLMFHGDAASPTTPVPGTDIIVPADQNPLVVLAPTSTGIVLTIDDAAEAPVLVKVGYRGGKRYSTIKCDETGATNGWPVSVVAVLSDASTKPVS